MPNVSRLLLAALIGAVLATAQSAASQPAAPTTTLTMSSWVSPQHHLTANVLQGWANEVEKATSGENLVERSYALDALDKLHSETIRDLRTTSWDLCITNPPYVRYQTTARATDGEMRLPSATEIRKGLIAAIDELHDFA